MELDNRHCIDVYRYRRVGRPIVGWWVCYCVGHRPGSFNGCKYTSSSSLILRAAHISTAVSVDVASYTVEAGSLFEVETDLILTSRSYSVYGQRQVFVPSVKPKLSRIVTTGSASD